MLLEKNHPLKLLFFGNSITDSGRDRSLHSTDLRSVFVKQVDAHLCSEHPQINNKIVNVGIFGN